MLFKAGKRIQVSGHIYTSNISYLLEFPLNKFEVILKLFPEQIQNSGIFRTRNVVRTLSIYPVKI